jgi:hypothetical protein
MSLMPSSSNGWYGGIGGQSNEVTAAGKKAQGWPPDSESKILFIMLQDDEQAKKELPNIQCDRSRIKERDTSILPWLSLHQSCYLQDISQILSIQIM